LLAGPIADPLPNWVTELSNVSAQQRWILLTNLKAATSYQFRVSAVNSVGEGSPSEPSNVVTLPQEGTTEIALLGLYFDLKYFHCV
jgi:protein sidekick